MPHKCHGHEEPNGNPAVSWLVVEASINTTERKTWSNKEAKICTNSRYRIPPGKTDGIMSQAATRTRGGPINVEPPSMRGERVSGVTMSSSVVGGQTGLKHVAHMRWSRRRQDAEINNEYWCQKANHGKSTTNTFDGQGGETQTAGGNRAPRNTSRSILRALAAVLG